MTGLAIVDTETVGLNAAIHGIWEVGLILHESPDKDGKGCPDEEFLWQLPVDLAHADPDALRISHFYDRRWRSAPPVPHVELNEWFSDAVMGYPDDSFYPSLEAPPSDKERYQVPVERLADWATRFAALTAGRILVGAVPSFDEKRLTMLLRSLGVAPAWHYRPVCVETLAVGYLAGKREIYDRDPTKYLNIVQGTEGRKPPPERVTLPWSSTSVSADVGVTRNAYGIHTALGDARWARDLWIKIMEDA